MINPSTNYYRKNRKTKTILYQCPHCSYSTCNTKIQLINHINAKHVDEEDRPYQCNCCQRGFAQKAHLDKHLAVVHDIKNIKPKVSSISYLINPTNNIPNSVKTKARYEYYKTHTVINTKDINQQKHEYLPNVYIKKHDIHYDANKGFIQLDKCILYKGNMCIKLPRRGNSN